MRCRKNWTSIGSLLSGTGDWTKDTTGLFKDWTRRRLQLNMERPKSRFCLLGTFHLLFQLQDFHHCWKIFHTLKIWTWFITDRMISFAEEVSFKRLLNILNFNGPQEKVQCIVLYMLYIWSSNFKINIRGVIYSLYT